MPCFSQHIFIESFDGNVCKLHVPLVIVLRTTVPPSLQDDGYNANCCFLLIILLQKLINLLQSPIWLLVSSWIKIVYSDKLS
jgi:hypothetical protein